MHQKSVQLRFGQRIGAFLLNRVLGGHHHERLVQSEGAHAYADLPLAHGLQQRRLHLGRRAVDLIGKHQVVENGAALEFELARFRPVDFAAGDV